MKYRAWDKEFDTQDEAKVYADEMGMPEEDIEEVQELTGEITAPCPICGKEISPDEMPTHWTEHKVKKEPEPEALTKETKEEEAKRWQLMAKLEEEDFAIKEGYQIPKCAHSLSTTQELIKEAKIRLGMVHYSKYMAGIKPFMNIFYTNPRKKFKLSEYGDVDFPRVCLLTDKKFETKRGATEEDVRKIFKEAAEETVEEEKKVQETLTKMSWADLTQGLFNAFDTLWSNPDKVDLVISEEGTVLGRIEKALNTKFSDFQVRTIGRDIFLRKRCPITSCEFKSTKTIDKEVFEDLVQHYFKEHLFKVEGKERLTVVERFIQEPEDSIKKAREAFTSKGPAREMMPHQTGSPNPEQCAEIEKLSRTRESKDFTDAEKKVYLEGLKTKDERNVKKLAHVFGEEEYLDEHDVEELQKSYGQYYYYPYAGKNEYYCRICKYKYPTFQAFYNHLKRQHPEYYKHPYKYKNYYP